MENAPHLVHDTAFLIPCPNLWRWFFYGIGLKIYDLLGSGNGFGKSRFISTQRAIELAPGMSAERLRGAILYHDGQFDDSRLLLAMAITAWQQGARLVNSMEVTGLRKDSRGRVTGVDVVDRENDQVFEINGRQIVNAGGPFCDSIRRMDDEGTSPMVAASQGVHLVLPKEFFPGSTAMIVPKTPDGRVIFIIPWQDHAVVGTTDTAIPEAVIEPTPPRAGDRIPARNLRPIPRAQTDTRGRSERVHRDSTAR